MSSERELRECPFCSGAARVCGDGDVGFCVVCDMPCGASFGEDYDRAGYPNYDFATEAEAIAAWNRRAVPPAAVAPDTEALVEFIRYCGLAAAFADWSDSKLDASAALRGRADARSDEWVREYHKKRRLYADLAFMFGRANGEMDDACMRKFDNARAALDAHVLGTVPKAEQERAE